MTNREKLTKTNIYDLLCSIQNVLSGKTFDRTQAMFNLAEECADVTIMMWQILSHYLGNEAEKRLDYFINQKLTRQIGRIESDKGISDNAYLSKRWLETR